MGYGMMNFGRVLDDTIFVDLSLVIPINQPWFFPRVCWGYTPQKFNIAPENWWLEDDPPSLLGFGNFSGANC